MIAAEDCQISPHNWKEIDQGGHYWRIAANMKSDMVWALSRTHMFDQGYLLYKFEKGVWTKDESQKLPAGGLNWNALAVDPNGDPSFITTDNKLARKKDGKWTIMEDCSTGVAIGTDGTLYRRDCDDLVNKYVAG